MEHRLTDGPFKSSAGRGAGQREAGGAHLSGHGELEVVTKLVQVIVRGGVVEDEDAGTTISLSFTVLGAV